MMDELIKKLEAWSMAKSDLHADRQLADEILLADGWKVEPDSGFEGGFRWYWGVNPQYSSSEGQRPHPINDLNAAVGVVPFKMYWQLQMHGDIASANVWMPRKDIKKGDLCWGRSERPSVAIVIAALKAKALLGSKGGESK